MFRILIFLLIGLDFKSYIIKLICIPGRIPLYSSARLVLCLSYLRLLCLRCTLCLLKLRGWEFQQPLWFCMYCLNRMRPKSFMHYWWGWEDNLLWLLMLKSFPALLWCDIQWKKLHWMLVVIYYCSHNSLIFPTFMNIHDSWGNKNLDIESALFDMMFNVVLFFMDLRKYEEICAPRVEEFCCITDNTYSRGEVSLCYFLVLTN